MIKKRKKTYREKLSHKTKQEYLDKLITINKDLGLGGKTIKISIVK